jgi:hypothetical protein
MVVAQHRHFDLVCIDKTDASIIQFLSFSVYITYPTKAISDSNIIIS